jgi:hypothetical protein
LDLIWIITCRRIHIEIHSSEDDSDDHRCSLLKVVDKITRARKTTRSAFIRDALEAEIRRQRIRENEIRHAEGYAQQPVALGEFDIWLREQDWDTP